MLHTLDVDGLLEETPEDVFQEWLAYFRADPWDEYRGDLRVGIVAAIADANRVGKPVAQTSNYMPFYREPKKRPVNRVERAKHWAAFAGIWNRR